jgi:hypothetical protein
MIIAVVLNAVFIAGGVLIIVMAMYHRMKTQEMQHRERLAMIERGLAPGPERNPAAFDSWQPRQGHPASTSVGVVIVALGLGLMLLIGVTATSPEVGIGVGGSIMVVGAAFIVNGELKRRSQPPISGPPFRPPSPPGS